MKYTEDRQDRLKEGGVYTMSDLRRLDPSGSLAQKADAQLHDYSGLIQRTRDQLHADAAPVDLTDDTEEALVPARNRRGGLGTLGDRINPDVDPRSGQRWR